MVSFFYLRSRLHIMDWPDSDMQYISFRDTFTDVRVNISTVKREYAPFGCADFGKLQNLLHLVIYMGTTYYMMEFSTGLSGIPKNNRSSRIGFYFSNSL